MACVQDGWSGVVYGRDYWCGYFVSPSGGPVPKPRKGPLEQSTQLALVVTTLRVALTLGEVRST